MTKYIYLLLFFVLSMCVTSCSNDAKDRKTNNNYVIVTSVSTDGKFVITTHHNNRAYLWDLEKHRYHLITSKPVNINSAYFIKNSYNYIYQLEKTNEVIIKDINGITIKKFNPGFKTYGQALTTNQNYYFSADKQLNLYRLDLSNNLLEQLTGLQSNAQHSEENANGMLASLTISPDENRLFSSDGSRLLVTDILSGLTKVIDKSNDQTISAISPDGSYVLSANFGRMLIKQVNNFNESIPFFIRTDSIIEYTKAHNRNNFIQGLISIKFIDDHNFIVLYQGLPTPLRQLGLYNIENMEKSPQYLTEYYLNPKKYLPLTGSFSAFDIASTRYPETKSAKNNQSIDTSPSAHILVMGQENEGGIMVYKYNPMTQELKLDWAPVLA